jgi:hypothetical protein
MPIKKEIIYPIFLESSQFAADNLWKNIFEDLSYGITPYGTYISKDFLCCSYKDKEFSYKIDQKGNSKLIYDDIYNLLTNNLGILSNKEKNKKRLDFNKIEQDIKDSRKCWSSIKKKNAKDILIEKYVIDMKNKYSLSIRQSKYLLSAVFIALVLKVFNQKDIIYEDGKIVKIDGIEFETKKIIIKKNIYGINVSFSPEIVLDKKAMYDNWEKYLIQLKKSKKICV